MKPYKISSLALASLLLLNTGCKSDLLDKVNPNEPSTIQFWNTSDDATRAMLAVYSGQQIFSTYSLYWHFDTEGRTDESFSASPALDLRGFMSFQQGSTNDSRSAFFWNDMYRMIFRANQVLTKVPGISMDATLKKRTIAEALYMRSMSYYDLGLLFGNLPLNLQLSDASTRVPQVSQEAVFAQLVTDLTAAKADLPLSYDAANKGRATRGAATALLGKVYMQQRKWLEASTQFAEIISSNQYSLVPNFADNFTEANENNSESIYEVQFSGVNQVFGQDFAGASEGNERAQFWGPSGTGFTDVEVRPWVFDEFSDRTLTGGIDPRRASTMFSIADTPTPYGKNFIAPPSAAVFGTPSNRWLTWRKYQNDRSRNFENFFSGINIRLIRYSDVLLMQAEALNELGRGTEAIPLINQVRARVNLTPLLVTLGANQAALRTQIRHERVTELAGEGVRWSDLVRYGLFDTPAGLTELKSRDADFNNFISPKNKLLPLPQADIDIDHALKQNPGF